jgi:hypothetical protein
MEWVWACYEEFQARSLSYQTETKGWEDNTNLGLGDSSYRLKTEFNSCFINYLLER